MENEDSSIERMMAFGATRWVSACANPARRQMRPVRIIATVLRSLSNNCDRFATVLRPFCDRFATDCGPILRSQASVSRTRCRTALRGFHRVTWEFLHTALLCVPKAIISHHFGLYFVLNSGLFRSDFDGCRCALRMLAAQESQPAAPQATPAIWTLRRTIQVRNTIID